MEVASETKEYYTTEDYFRFPEDERLEIIGGKLYMMATPSTVHQMVSGEVFATIRDHLRENNNGCRVFHAPFAVDLSSVRKDTVVEPDIAVICDKSRLNKRGYHGAPEWIIEILSPSNNKHDLIEKLVLYAEAGVREYWIIDPERERIFVYFLEESNATVDVYQYSDTVPVNICDGFAIDFSTLDLRI